MRESLSHEQAWELLSLAAAGALEAGEQSALAAHIENCAVCAQEAAELALYVRAFASLPQPAAPKGLLERTARTLASETPAEAHSFARDWLFAALSIFAWAAGLVPWWCLREIGGGSLQIFDLDLTNVWVWSGLSLVMTWTTAGAVALAASRHKQEMEMSL